MRLPKEEEGRGGRREWEEKEKEIRKDKEKEREKDRKKEKERESKRERKKETIMEGGDPLVVLVPLTC